MGKATRHPKIPIPRIVQSFAEHTTIADVAADLGVSVPEVHDLLAAYPVRKALASLAHGIAAHVAPALAARALRATEALILIAEDPDAQDAARVGAAAAILERHEKWIEREDLRREIEATKREIAKLRRDLDAPPEEGADLGGEPTD